MTMRETMDDIDEEELRSLKAGSMPAAYDDPEAPEMPMPGDDVDAPEPAGEMVLPEMDFRSEVQTQPTGSSGPTAFREPAAPSPAQNANDEYAAALRKIRDHLAKPAPDYSKGYAQAHSKDVGENRISRIMDFINAAQRRAATPNTSPLATNAAGFLQKSQLERAQSDGELARLGKVAQLARPMKAGAGAGKDPGNVEALRAYLVKVGAGSPEELSGMNEKQLGAVMSAYGLKHNIDREPVEDEFKRTAHADSMANAAATRALAYRGINEKNQDDVSNDAKALAEKLGDTAVFEQRYQKLQDLIKANGGEVPGLGRVEGVRQQPGFLGSAVRMVSPPSQQAVAGRKALRQLAADYARAISGAGVSDSERENLNAATIDVDNDDSAIAMAGLESLREMYEAKAAQLKKGYRPEAVDRVSGGVKMSNGKETLVVQPDDVAAAEADGFKRVR